MSEIDILKRRLEREISARKEAERLLEEKSRQLYAVNIELKELNASLTEEVNIRTAETIKSEKKYRELVESASDVIYQCNKRGEFIYVNPVAEKITGYSFDEVKNRSFHEFVRPDYLKKVASFYVRQLIEEIPSTYLEFPFITAEGKTLWFGQTVNIHYNDDGDIEFMVLARDITDLKIAREATERSEEKYRSIIENLELGLVEVGLDDRITKVYPQFCEMSGYDEKDLIGKRIKETLLPTEFWGVVEKQEALRQEGKPGVYEVQIIKKTGERAWVIISGAPFFGIDGEIQGTIGIHLDISDRKEMEDQLRESIELAKSSVRSKELFMANMSHEIRTPMNAIIGMSELLGQSSLNPKQTDYVSAISTSANNLLIIINDILDFSKIEAGKMELDPTPVNLKDTIINAAKTLELKAEEKGVGLIVHLDESLQNYLVDKTRLNQILINLLSNGIKFTESGKVTVECMLLERKETTTRIHFAITDTGIGIAEDKLDDIFESFSQAERSTARKYGGTGLGLPISRELIQMMGSDLFVESKLGEGTCFSFTLELEETDLPAEVVNPKNVDFSALNGIRVLLVEDHPINRFMAVTILENWQCEVEIAENGIQAIEQLKESEFDIILMDIMMPEMDGMTATGKIRSELKLNTPIIALTANAIKGDDQKYRDAGMNGYVSKPFVQEELFNQITQLLSLEQKEPSSPAPSLSSGEKLVDLSRLKQSTNGDEAFMKKMIQLFIDTTPGQLDNLKSNLKQGDLEAVRKIAHGMKPSIDHLASKFLQDLVRQIENGEHSQNDFMDLTGRLIAHIEQLIEALKAHL